MLNGGRSRFLTTHQHITGYTVSFTLYDLHKKCSSCSYLHATYRVHYGLLMHQLVCENSSHVNHMHNAPDFHGFTF